RYDRVADELAGAVPGDAAAAVDVDDRRAVGGSVFGLRALARRVDRVVLQQHQHVGPGARAAGLGVGALGVPRGDVLDHPDAVDPHRTCITTARPEHVRHATPTRAGLDSSAASTLRGQPSWGAT